MKSYGVFLLIGMFSIQETIGQLNTSQTFDRPFQQVPDPGDRPYYIEKVTDVGEDTLNYTVSRLLNVEISGKNINIRLKDPKSIFERYNNKINIKAFKIFAETLTIEGQFYLPQTNIEIFA